MISKSPIVDIEAHAAIFALLDQRRDDATVCPSEVARVLAAAGGATDWRSQMSRVHEEVDRLVPEGLIRLSWKGVAMPERDGPYRIGR